MASVPGVDHPEEQGEADVSLADRGISVSARVEFVHDGVLTVRPSAGEFVDQVVVGLGNAVEVYWKGPEDQRMVPAEVIGVETGAVVRWRMRMTGPAEQSQRRKAVRGRVRVPVEVGYGAFELTGETVDLSEAGMRVQCEGVGVPPEAGTALDVVVALEDGELRTKAEVVRLHVRGARWVMSIRFVGLAEREQDRVRRRVFQALREERARSAD